MKIAEILLSNINEMKAGVGDISKIGIITSSKKGNDIKLVVDVSQPSLEMPNSIHTKAFDELFKLFKKNKMTLMNVGKPIVLEIKDSAMDLDKNDFGLNFKKLAKSMYDTFEKHKLLKMVESSKEDQLAKAMASIEKQFSAPSKKEAPKKDDTPNKNSLLDLEIAIIDFKDAGKPTSAKLLQKKLDRVNKGEDTLKGNGDFNLLDLKGPLLKRRIHLLNNVLKKKEHKNRVKDFFKWAEKRGALKKFPMLKDEWPV